jgi:soluble lytic murein transglycosylase-like protein
MLQRTRTYLLATSISVLSLVGMTAIANVRHHLSAAGLSEREINRLDPNRIRTAHAIIQQSVELDVPIEFALRVAWQESRFNARAVGPPTLWGRAYGPLQVLPSTARTVEQHVTARDLLSNDAGVRVGLRYLRNALREANGDQHTAAMRYHGGPNRRLWGQRTRAYAAAIARNRTQQQHVDLNFQQRMFAITNQ